MGDRTPRVALFAGVFMLTLLAGSRDAVRPGLAADAPPAGAAKTVVRRGVMSLTAVGWPDFIATALGFYDRQGLDVETSLVDPPTTVSALIGGSLDVAVADATGVVLGVDKGANLVSVGTVADRNPYKLMTSPAIKTFADLKGKKIAAASPVEVYTTVIKAILKKGGLDPEKDVEFVFGGGQNQRLAAILGGAVQAGLFSLPADSKLTERGYNTLAFTPDFFPHLALSVTTTRRDWAQQHPDVLRRYLRAQADASAWLNNPANKERAVAILAKATNTTLEESAPAYDYYVRTKQFPNNACVTTVGFAVLLKILADEGQLTKLTPADAGKFTDTEWCPKS